MTQSRRRGCLALSLAAIFASCMTPQLQQTVATQERTTKTVESTTRPTTGVPEWDAMLDEFEMMPIEGYGDFSTYESNFDIDRVELTTLIIQCMTDQGFEVTGGNGTVSFSQIPQQQNRLAQATYVACTVGLHAPVAKPLTNSQLELIYHYQLALSECYARAGYSQEGDIVSLDVFLEDEGGWDLQSIFDIPPGGSAWDALEKDCPQSPVGGWGAWSVGDPIRAVP